MSTDRASNNPIRKVLLCTILLMVVPQLLVAQAESEAADNQQPEIASHEETDSQIAAEDRKELDEPQVAPNLDLSEVAPIPEPIVEEVRGPASVIAESAEDQITLEESDPLESTQTADETQIIVPLEPEEEEHFVILGAEVQPATATRLAWSPGVTITGLALPTPVLVINGAEPGPTLCLSSAVHGDELNGIEIVRRVMYDIDPARLHGKIIGVPIVNLQGFQRGSRYLPDRRDLNRFFPGDSSGSLASRIAESFFKEVISHCDMLVDLHTGSLGRTNLPQIRADMNHPEIAELTEGFDKMVVVHSPGSEGMLRTAAVQSGIVSVTMEVGESLRVQEDDIRMGVNSIYSLMEKEGMFSRRFVWGRPAPVYYTSFWLRVQTGGLLFSNADLGDTVYEGQVLGTVTDPITNESSEIVVPVRGRIIGMAVDQVVMPGFAAYHIGRVATEETIIDPSLPVDEVISGEASLESDLDLEE